MSLSGMRQKINFQPYKWRSIPFYSNQSLLWKCTEGSYNHRMSFLYLRTRHTAAIHVMTIPGQLIKPFDPFKFMSYKSAFTVSPASVRQKSCPIRRGDGVSTFQSPWGKDHTFKTLFSSSSVIRCEVVYRLNSKIGQWHNGLRPSSLVWQFPASDLCNSDHVAVITTVIVV